MGAVVFADFWIVPKLGLQRYYAESRGILFSWPGFLAWALSLGVCFALPIELFFKALPGWFIAVVTFLLCSAIQQRTTAKGPQS
jgi:cytosine permease